MIVLTPYIKQGSLVVDREASLDSSSLHLLEDSPHPLHVHPTQLTQVTATVSSTRGLFKPSRSLFVQLRMSRHVHLVRPCDRCYSDPVAVSPIDASIHGGGLDRPFTPGPSVKPIDSFETTLHPGCPSCSNDPPFGFRTTRGHDEIRYRRPYIQTHTRRNSAAPFPDQIMDIFGLLPSQVNVHFVPALTCQDSTAQRSSISSDFLDDQGGQIAEASTAFPQRLTSVSQDDVKNNEPLQVRRSRGRRAKFIKRLARWLSAFASALGQKDELPIGLEPVRERRDMVEADTGAAKAMYDSDVCETPRRISSHRNSMRTIETRSPAEIAPQSNMEVTRASSTTIVNQSEQSTTEEVVAVDTQPRQVPVESTEPTTSSDEGGKWNIFVSTSMYCRCSSSCQHCENVLQASSQGAQAPTIGRRSLESRVESERSMPTPAPTLNTSREVVYMGGDRQSSVPRNQRQSRNDSTGVFGTRRHSGLSTITSAPSLSIGPSVSSTSLDTVFRYDR